MAESVADEILRVLGEFFDQKIRFKGVIIGWPDFSQKLTLPSVSLLIKTPTYTPRASYEQSKAKIKPLSADILYVAGEWDFAIQVDCWLKTKAERNDIQEKVFNAVHTQNREDVKPVFQLPMPNYHGQIATFTYLGYKFPDEGETSITGEWRLIVNMRGECNSIVRVSAPLIKTIDITVVVQETEIIE